MYFSFSAMCLHQELEVGLHAMGVKNARERSGALKRMDGRQRKGIIYSELWLTFGSIGCSCILLELLERVPVASVSCDPSWLR